MIGIKIDQRNEGIVEKSIVLSLSLSLVNIHRRNSFTKHVRVLRARHLLRNQKKRKTGMGIAVWMEGWIDFQSGRGI